MRKLALLAAVVAMVGAVSADAANVTFGIRQAGGGSGTVTVDADDVVQIEITANVDSAVNLSDGLALWGTDLVFSGAAVRANLTGGLLNDPASGADPAGAMHNHFDYPNGVTNPPHAADASGYRGTASGALNLLQGGGGQNTIGNPASGGAPFPIGSVLTDVAQNATVVVATGSYAVGATTDVTHTITLANCFANTIDDGEAGPTVYNVSAATTACGAALNIFVQGGGGGDVLTAVSRKATGPACDLPLNLAGRTSEARNSRVSQIVIDYSAAPSGPAVTLEWNTVLTPCPGAPAYVAYNGLSVWSCTNADPMVCNFAPALENVHAYRLTVPDGATTRQIQFRGLTADANSDGQVNAADRSAVIGQWTAPGYACNTDVSTDINEDGPTLPNGTNAADRSAVIGAWTNPNARCVP